MSRSEEEISPQDVFSHRLNLSGRDKIIFLLSAPLLVPVRILLSLLLALLIWTSSRLGLLFSEPEVRFQTFPLSSI